MRCRSPSLISLSFARMRSPRLLRFRRKPPLRDLPQMKVKPRKLKVSGLPSPRRLAVGRRKAAELDQAGLVRMQRQRERRQPFAHRIEEAAGVGLVLEADDDVVGIAYDDHVARGLAPSPALGPQVEDVVQVDVGEQRRDRRALPRPPARDLDPSVFENARLQPFLDQAEDALVADAMLEEADEPFLAHRVEELRDVGVDDEVHLRAVDGRRQRVERVMRAASRPEAVAEAEEVFLVDRVQHVDHGALDDLVLQRRDRQRASTAVRLGYVDPPARRRPIRSARGPARAGPRACARGPPRSPPTSLRRSRRRRSSSRGTPLRRAST